jgi:hypothetical protein
MLNYIEKRKFTYYVMNNSLLNKGRSIFISSYGLLLSKRDVDAFLGILSNDFY